MFKCEKVDANADLFILKNDAVDGIDGMCIQIHSWEMIGM